MNKGFTLVELLAVIVILAIILGVGVLSYTSITKKTEDDYYTNLIDSLELDGANYFNVNRSERPGFDSAGNLKNKAKVSLTKLLNERYTESINDHKGNACSESDLNNSFVCIIRNSNKQYEYEVKLICNDYKYNEDYSCN